MSYWMTYIEHTQHRKMPVGKKWKKVTSRDTTGNVIRTHPCAQWGLQGGEYCTLILNVPHLQYKT